MKKFFKYIFILLFSLSLNAQDDCPEDINHNNNNLNFMVTIYVYNIDGIIIDSIECSVAGNSGSVNCDLSSFDDSYIFSYTTDDSECFYDSDGDLIDNLPIELSHFTPIFENNYNKIEWATYSERNNDYFIIEYSSDGIEWSEIHKEYGQGNSTDYNEYSFIDRNFEQNNINYYRLTQYDYNGDYETFDIKSVDNFGKELLKIIDLMGKEVDNKFQLSGIFIYIYTDGTKEKVYH